MSVFVLVEFTGTAHEVDGAIVIGVYISRDEAEAELEKLTTPRKPRTWFDISEHQLKRHD